MGKGYGKMKGAECEGRIYVKITELREKDDVLVYRRRECRKCGRRFSTYEIKIEDYQHIKECAVKLDTFHDLFRRA